MSERVVVVNASKMNYDHALDFSVLSSDVQVYDDSTNEELIERIQGARVVVTKELPVGADLISQFPDTVKLIVEAGTGYNNIDLNVAKERGITVCNIPAYSTERVAHTVIMMILNFASTMQKQIGMLAKGDRSNFTKYLQVSHTEVNGKTLGVVGAGHIGMEVIKVAKALGMNILVHTRTPKADGDGIRYVSLDELL
ncbi:MAG: D-2-hydroxyacid dehydrogenase, partial [Veillonella sp.]|nr:D-2-hydroxyacid dehydrogenase [Veillonella sp.]